MVAVHPEDRDWVMAEDARVAEAGEVFRAEYRLLTKDGQTRWVREEAVPVADDRSGAITLWQGVRFDITQEKEAEERLRAAEERYRLVVEQLPAIAYVDERRDIAGSRTWPCVYVSPQVETILGFTPEEWVSGPETWDDMIHPDDLERAAEADTRHYEHGEPVDVEIRIKARDGEYRWIRDQAVIVYDDEGEPRWSQGIWLDVTERKLAELALEEAEHRYRGIVEHVPAAIYLDKVDASMESVYVSPQIETIAGVTSRAVDGRARPVAAPHRRRGPRPGRGLLPAGGGGEATVERRVPDAHARRPHDLGPRRDHVPRRARRGAALHAGRDLRHHRAQARRAGAARVRAARARGRRAPPLARRDEEHVPRGGLPRAAEPAHVDPGPVDHPRATPRRSATRTAPTCSAAWPATRASSTGS